MKGDKIMAEYCGECAHLDWNNKERYTSRDRYYCDRCGKYVELTESSCYRFIKDPSKTKEDGGYTPSGCYITTIVCSVLGYSDNCELLETLRSFRENVLKQNVNYIPILIEYDEIGPVISEKISSKEDSYKFCLELMKNYLIPCANLINNGNFEQAVSVYQNMVFYLNDYFGLEGITVDENKTYDLENLGKGRIRSQIIPAT